MDGRCLAPQPQLKIREKESTVACSDAITTTLCKREMDFLRALSTHHTRLQLVVGTFLEDQVTAGGSLILVSTSHVVTHVGRNHLVTISAASRS